MRSRRVFLASLGLLVLSLTSCGKSDGRQRTFPVSGKVLVNGNPLEHATIVFHPIGATGPEVIKPRGKVAADGAFTLTSYDGNDGAPAGDYQVTIELWLSTGRGDEGPTSRLPAKFARPESSGLTATVNAGPTELQPFNLKW
jgi:hypothetical protein